MLLIHYSITLYHPQPPPHCSTHTFTIASQLFHHTLLSLRHCFHPVPTTTFMITGPLFHCFTTLYYHCATLPPHLPFTAPLFSLFHHPLYNPLRHCSITLYYQCAAAPLFLHTLLLPHHCSTVPPHFYHTLRHCSTL